MSDDIHLDRQGRLGVVTLDRPKTLNALTHDMVRALSLQLCAWRDDPAIGAVLIRAVPGRAFCAGGDIRVVTDLAASEGPDAPMPFFHDEYRLNWRIKQFSKPYIALLDGIVMGGGVGISVHGSHRIVTERTMFAMPETGIGMFPDVGGTYFLPRLPGELGTYMGLTGARLGGADCLHGGIGTHYVHSERLGALTAALAEGEPDAVLPDFHEAPGPAPIDELLPGIDAHMGAGSLAGLLASLKDSSDPFAAATLDLLRQKSPIAVAVALRQLRLGRERDFAECMRLEYRLVRHILAHGDFAEGVRALIVDKDKRPRWQDATLEQVSEAEVEAFFSSWPGDALAFDWHGL